MKQAAIFSILIVVFIQTATASPIIWTADISGQQQIDFPPDSLVYIHGTGFLETAFVTIMITKPNNAIDYGFEITDESGSFIWIYDLNGMEGIYTVTVTDGLNTATTYFTDSSVWTTDGFAQQKNSFSCGEEIGLNGEKLTQSATLDYIICDRPGGNPCNGNIVKSGTVQTNSAGDIIFEIIWVVPPFYTNGGTQHKVVVFDTQSKTKTFAVACACVDNDQDGYPAYDAFLCPFGNDCDDNNPNINPGATEICDDLIDNDCDGLIDCADPDCDCPISECTIDSECDDGNACTIDTCESGTCSYTPVTCPTDGNICTRDYCDPLTGCVYEPLTGTGCDDGLFCTTGDTCQEGICVGGAPTDCSFFTDQCNIGTCDEERNICYPDPAPAEGNPCDDNFFCTTGETCTNGLCTGGTITDCDDNNECTTDLCDTVSDQCINSPKPTGTLCGFPRSCPDPSCDGFYAQIFPSDGHDSCDGLGVCIPYSCDATSRYCTDNDPFDGVNGITCGAQCDQDTDCPKTYCSYLTGCYQGTYRVYQDAQNTCADCSCTNNPCIYTEPAQDSDNDGVDDPCDICPNSIPGEPVNAQGCDPFQFCRQFSCGNSCYLADFIPLGSQPETGYPFDCTVVIKNNEGTHEILCVPLTCAD